MILFPFVRPRRGLAISEEALRHVEIVNRWGTSRVREITVRPLPPGLLRLSPTAVNIADVPVLVEVLKSVAGRGTGATATAIMLPDVCARSAVFEFSSFPTARAEQDALLRWRFQQDLHVPAPHGRLGFQVYRPSRVAHRSGSTTSRTIRVLAVLVQQDVIEQYEQACLDAGLLPVSVSLAGLDVLDACRAVVDAKRGRQSLGESGPAERVFLFLGEWGSTCLVLQDEVPAFVRVKRMPWATPRRSAEPGLTTESSTAEEVSTAEKPADPLDRGGVGDPEADAKRMEDMMRAITNEFVATLHYYCDQAPDPDRKGRRVPVYAVDGVGGQMSLLPSSEEIQPLLEAGNPDSPRLDIVACSHELLSTMVRATSLPAVCDRSALAAFAGVMGH